MRLKCNQRGVAALLTTIFVAIFLSILTIGLANVLNTEQQQTLDVHNSDRAEAAAQAGIEDGLARLQYWASLGCTYSENPNPQVSGSASACSGPPGAVKITSCPSSGKTDNLWQFTENEGEACVIHRTITSHNASDLYGEISAENDEPNGPLKSEQYPKTEQYNLGSNTTDVVVDWGFTNAEDSFPTGVVPKPCSLATPWPGHTGPLELTRVGFNDNGSVDTPTKGVFLPNEANTGESGCVPQSYYNGLASSVSGCNSPPYSLITPALDQAAADAGGSSASPFEFCTAIKLQINGSFPNAYLRMRALYDPINYQIYFLNCSSNSCQFSNAPINASTIDVTGESGGAYRRVIATANANTSNLYSVFDFVLFSEQGLNKSYACINAAPNATCN